MLRTQAPTPCEALRLSLLGTKILTRDGGAKPGILELRKLRQVYGKFEASLSCETLNFKLGPTSPSTLHLSAEHPLCLAL